MTAKLFSPSSSFGVPSGGRGCVPFCGSIRGRNACVHALSRRSLLFGFRARTRARLAREAARLRVAGTGTASVDGTVSVAYLVFNTIMNLTTQEAQVAYFRSVAAHLEPGSCFVIEVGVPELAAAATGRDHPRLQRKRDQLGLRRVRRRQPGPHLSPLRARRRTRRAALDSLPRRLARRGWARRFRSCACPRVGGPAGAGAMGAVRSFAARWRRTVRLEENWRP